jgi:hypothetical protein
MIEAFVGMKDVLLGYDTDIYFENNDLMLCTGIDYIEREIYKLMITEQGDWKANPTIGCSPNSFTGEQNTRELGKRMEFFIREGLKSTAFPSQVTVRVVPTGYEHLMVFVDIYVQNSEVTSIPFEFDFINGIRKLTRMDARTTKPKSSDNYKINDIANLKRPNKYWNQMRDQYITT